jgi:hypothetical protein
MPKVNSLSDIGAKRESLSSGEMEALTRAFSRGLADLRSDGSEVVRDKLRQYREEIQVAASIAREELAGSFDGQSPTSGNFGVDAIHPGYFGYDSWDDMPVITGGDEFDWFDDDTPTNLSSGSSGFANPLRIGDPVTHIILGFGSYADDPVTSRIKEQKNDSPKPALTTEDVFRNTDVRIKWKDTPTILQPDDTYAVRGFAGGEVGRDYEEALYPVGLTFIEANEYRLLDPADMAGTSDNDIVIET